MKRERQGLPPITSEDSTNAISSLPDNFNDWASANSDRIQRATHRGTLPYFLADNFNVGKNGELVRKTPEAKPKTVAAKAAVPPKLSLLQRAEQRHKARTEEEVEEIQKAWLKRFESNYYTIYRQFDNGGLFLIDKQFSSKDKKKPDFYKVRKIGEEFARSGNRVIMSIPIHYKDWKYKKVFGTLI